MRVRSRYFFVAALLVGLTACASDSSGGGTAASTTAAPAPTAVTTVAVSPEATDASPAGDGQEAPTTDSVAAPEAIQFTAPLVGGGELDLAQFAGTPVALWFWAPT